MIKDKTENAYKILKAYTGLWRTDVAKANGVSRQYLYLAKKERTIIFINKSINDCIIGLENKIQELEALKEYIASSFEPIPQNNKINEKKVGK